MSKGISHLFEGTSGSSKALINQVKLNGDKISPDKVVMITKDPTGRIIWMETGDKKSGLNHIIDNHGKEFNGRGISNDKIPNYVFEAVHQGNIVGKQGKRNPRDIYEFTYNGTKQRIAVQVASNGYIVSANCVSTKEKGT